MVKPILFSTPMVQAILKGQKTQTRRVIKPQPAAHSPVVQIIEHCSPDYYWDKTKGYWFLKSSFYGLLCDGKHVGGYLVKPLCKAGDILYVREQFCRKYDGTGDAIEYRADWKQKDHKHGDPGDNPYGFEIPSWRPSIYMPKAAARIFLRVTNVRAERVQEITPHDAWDEGCRLGKSFPFEEHIPALQQMCIDIRFIPLWNSINAKRGYGWDTNPWVWVYTFERCEKPEGWRAICAGNSSLRTRGKVGEGNALPQSDGGAHE